MVKTGPLPTQTRDRKLVYYGGATAGLAANIVYLYDHLQPSARGQFRTIPHAGDETLHFDFVLPGLGEIRSYKRSC